MNNTKITVIDREYMNNATMHFPKNGNRIDWAKSVGLSVNIDWNGEILVLTIKSYTKEKSRITISNKAKVDFEIFTGHFMQGKLNKFLSFTSFYDWCESNNMSILLEDFIVNNDKNPKDISYCTDAKYLIKCPSCGDTKKIRLGSISYQGFSCKCNSQSFSESCMESILKQLNIEYTPQASSTNCLKWANKYRYDFYLNKLDTIIETHGIQHYKNTSDVWTTLEHVMLNDKNKKSLALKHVDNYIEVDAKISNVDYFINSLYKTKFGDITKSKQDELDKIMIYENTLKSKKLEVYRMWVNMSDDEKYPRGIKDISNMLKIDYSTANKWINDASELHYMYDGIVIVYNKNISNAKKGTRIEVFKNNETLGIFDNAHVLAKESINVFGVSFNVPNILMVCNNKKKCYKGYEFKYIYGGKDNV